MADVTASARLSADASDFRSEMNSAARFADGVGDRIAKKFEFRDIGRTLATALGLNIENIAEKLTVPFKEAAEDAKSIADASERSARAVNALIALHQTDVQQLVTLQREQKKLNDEIGKPTKEISLWRQALGAAALTMGLTGVAAKLFANESANAAKAAEDTAKAGEHALDVERKKQEVEDKRFDQQVKNEQARSAYVDKNREMLELEAKVLINRITPEEMKRLQILRLQSKELQTNGYIADLLSTALERKLTPEEKARLAVLIRQRETIEKEIGLVTAGLTPAVSETKKEVESVLKTWKDVESVMIAIQRVGRGDKEMSDRELERKATNLRKEISQRQIAQQGTYQGSALMQPYDFLLGAQQGALQQVVAEMNLRRSVRNAAGAFGQDAAFRQFGGLTEQQFADILRNSPDTSEQTGLLRDIKDALVTRGIRTLPLGGR